MTRHVGVIGAGPVGLVAAILAARAGHQVSLFDRRPGPIDKACGEGLMPGAVGFLASLNIHLEGRPLTGVSYRQGARHVDHLFPESPGRGVRRTHLHQLLSDRALDDGVVRVSDGIHSVTPGADSVRLTTDLGSVIDCDYVLACDGLHSPTARGLGVRKGSPLRPTSRRFGLRQHFQVAPWSTLIEVHYTPHSEVYITPVADNEVGVAILGGQGLNLEQSIQKVPGLAVRLKGARPTSSLRGAGPFPQSTTRRAVGRVLLVGDSSGYVDAITGEGLRVGFEQAGVAVSAITADAPHEYEHAWKRVTRDFRLLTAGLTALVTSPFRPAIVPLAGALPPVFGAVVNRLAR